MKRRDKLIDDGLISGMRNVGNSLFETQRFQYLITMLT